MTNTENTLSESQKKNIKKKNYAVLFMLLGLIALFYFIAILKIKGTY